MRVPMAVVDGVRYRPEHVPVVAVPLEDETGEVVVAAVLVQPDEVAPRRGARAVQTKQAGVDRPA